MPSKSLSNYRKARDFRVFLRGVLADRKKKNPRYSQTAFAKALGVSPSALSEILKEDRVLTEKTKTRMGLRLGLSSKQLSNFDHSPSKRHPILFKSCRPISTLTLDAYAVISDWYHYAILELTNLAWFKSSIEDAASALGISNAEAKEATERLFRLGYLAKNEDGHWYDTTSEKGVLSNIDEKTTSAANKKLQRQILEKSLNSLSEDPLNLRNHTSMTMAINIKDLPKALEKIKEFRRSLAFELTGTESATDIYNLHVGFYRLTKGDKCEG